MAKKKYHKCDRGICGDAPCCRDTYSVPTLTLGDYSRMADATGESTSSIWRNNGSITLITNYHSGEVYHGLC